MDTQSGINYHGLDLTDVTFPDVNVDLRREV